MTRGRKPLPAAETPEAAISPATAADLNAKTTELVLLDREAEARTHDLALKLGYDGPLDPDVIERGVTLQMRRTVEACLETGRMLLILKERVGHGSFTERLDRLGVAPRAAQKFMQSALKFSNAPLTAHLVDAIGSQTKLIELLVLDEEEIHELATEGSVLGITTDDVAAMSMAELRKALRDARQTQAARDKLLEKKDKRINALEEQLDAPWQPDEDTAAATAEQQRMLDAVREHVVAAELSLVQLANVASEIFDTAELPEAAGAYARQSIEYLAQRIGALANSHGITIDMDALAPAPWEEKARAKAAGRKAKA